MKVGFLLRCWVGLNLVALAVAGRVYGSLERSNPNKRAFATQYWLRTMHIASQRMNTEIAVSVWRARTGRKASEALSFEQGFTLRRRLLSFVLYISVIVLVSIPAVAYVRICLAFVLSLELFGYRFWP